MMRLMSVLEPAAAWIAIIGFVVITTVCLLLGLGSILNVIFPIGALFVGSLLFFKYQTLYFGFIWWLFILTPLIRRIADFQSEFTNPSPILLAPFAACIYTLLTVVRYIPKSSRINGLPLVFTLVGVLYACAVGFVTAPKLSWTVGTLNVLLPISCAFHVYVNWKKYLAYKKNLICVFLWAVPIMSLYGIYQYLVAPEWDRFWLVNVFGENAELLNLLGTPFGTPQPFGIRVWSTMNGPLDFAMVMMVGLCIILINEGHTTILSSVLGYLSLLLSLARTAWIACAISLMLLFVRVQQRVQFRLILVFLCISVLVTPIAIQEPFSSLIQERLQSFSNISNDGSGVERQETYQLLSEKISTNVLGLGVGAELEIDRPLDSSILYLLIYFGWAGSLLYFGGLIASLFQVFQSAVKVNDEFMASSQAVVLGYMTIFPLGPVVLGVTGVLFWFLVGLNMAGVKYYKNQ